MSEGTPSRESRSPLDAITMWERKLEQNEMLELDAEEARDVLYSAAGEILRNGVEEIVNGSPVNKANLRLTLDLITRATGGLAVGFLIDDFLRKHSDNGQIVAMVGMDRVYNAVDSSPYEEVKFKSGGKTTLLDLISVAGLELGLRTLGATVSEERPGGADNESLVLRQLVENNLYDFLHTFGRLGRVFDRIRGNVPQLIENLQLEGTVDHVDTILRTAFEALKKKAIQENTTFEKLLDLYFMVNQNSPVVGWLKERFQQLDEEITRREAGGEAGEPRDRVAKVL